MGISRRGKRIAVSYYSKTAFRIDGITIEDNNHNRLRRTGFGSKSVLIYDRKIFIFLSLSVE